ncbi:PREDICTED: RING-H2 finger protein ATL32-like [Populus euphratica]|uniref:RING-H2 finger protein ATL32-like n=1 Tax=Populus euphratica TaxID=75702 RepID=A0AAJ6UMN7_POPEU|nr:PREDICTED: RING-H2 finger protein ATL32-like [Populus euphratica]
MIASGINLVMTVIGFAVSTMFIVFVCTRLLCARIQLNASRRAFPTASGSNLSLLERGGLEHVFLANFPTKKYNDKIFSASEDAQCTICLAEYHGDDILRILPYCGHSFHVNCVDIWLQQHSTCPVCRISLREFPAKKHVMQPLFSSAIRSQYGTETFDSHSYNYMLTEQGISPSYNNHGMDPIQDNHCASDGDEEGRENSPPLTESNQIARDIADKHVESPSNS